MAEFVAAAGVAASVTQLAGQTFNLLATVYSFWKKVQGAPKQVSNSLRDIRMLARILKNLPLDEFCDQELITEALEYTNETLAEIQQLLEKFQIQLQKNQEKGSLQW